MAKRGRPSRYRPEFAEQAYNIALLGKTDEEIAASFGINPDTLYEWKKKYPEFAESIRLGKLPADGKVARALYERAIGYSHEAVKIFSFEGVTFEHKYTEHYPPEYNCIRLFLMNRQPLLWRDKQVLETDSDDGALAEVAKAIAASPTEPPKTE